MKVTNYIISGIIAALTALIVSEFRTPDLNADKKQSTQGVETVNNLTNELSQLIQRVQFLETKSESQESNFELMSSCQASLASVEDSDYSILTNGINMVDLDVADLRLAVNQPSTMDESGKP